MNREAIYKRNNVNDGTFGNWETACKRYSLGEAAMRKVAKDAKAVIHVPGVKLTRISFDKVDQYLKDNAN